MVRAVIVEEEVRFTFDELCKACRAEASQVVTLVEEGVLAPTGNGPGDWQFAGPSLRRARVALRLSRDLQLGAGGTALVMDLLDEIESLRAQLRRR